MSKKKTTKKVQVEEPTVEAAEVNVVEAPAIAEEAVEPEPLTWPEESSSDKWEVKDRTYKLKNGLSPLSYAIKCSNMYFFDEDRGYEREMKYTANQNTPFVDEFKGTARMKHIVFEDGVLFVPKQKQVLQKLLSIYHPDLGKVYVEHKPKEIAVDQVANLELEIEALMLARTLDLDMAEAVMRVEIGSRVSKMSSKELKRDLLLFAKKNPKLFLDLANDDNVMLRNLGVRAVENRIIKLSSDQRTFSWASTDRKLFTVPFDEHPYSALAAWFKTDEGMEVFSQVEKRLK